MIDERSDEPRHVLRGAPAPPPPPPEAVVFYDGDFVPAPDAPLNSRHPDAQFQFGFFERFRTCGGRPHLWALHVRRLQAACAIANIKLPEWFLARDEAWLRAVVRRLLEANQVEDAVFRYTVTADPLAAEAKHGPFEALVPEVFAPPPPPDGVVLRVLNLARDNGEWLPRPNSIHRPNTALGRAELQGRTGNPTDDGLFLARETGYVVETLHQSIAWVRQGKTYYPDPAIGSIAGTGLQWLAELSGGQMEPRRADLQELMEASAIVLINSIDGITPVRSLYGKCDETLRREIPSIGHPIVKALQERWEVGLAASARP